MPTHPYGWTIFCDDIRQEVGGKFSFMGTYGGTLIVHGALPATLPKFALAVRYRIALDDDRLDDVHITVFLPGDEEDKPSIAAVIPISKMIENDDPPTRPGDEFREFHANIILTPLALKERGKIRVRATGGAGTIRLGTLRVDQQGQPSHSDTGS